MFEFYTNNTFEGQNSFNWISIIQVLIQLVTLGIASIALYTARKSLSTSNQNLNTANKNLEGVSRTQAVQSHMNLITLENEVRKNGENFRMATKKHKITTDTNKNATELELMFLTDNMDNAFVLYMNSADKLASLVNTDYLKKQFQNRDWKEEYKDIFDEVNSSFKDYDIEISGKSQMIRNLIILLEIWDKENLENPSNTIITNSLPNT